MKCLRSPKYTYSAWDETNAWDHNVWTIGTKFYRAGQYVCVCITYRLMCYIVARNTLTSYESSIIQADSKP